MITKKIIFKKYNILVNPILSMTIIVGKVSEFFLHITIYNPWMCINTTLYTKICYCLARK